jgi:hypothetical protein
MKNWLKYKIREWLGVEDNCNLIKYNQERIDVQRKDIREINRKIYSLKLPQETIKDINITEEKINKLVDHFQLGVDVHTHGDSWAVFCIGGKMEYVRFVRLPCKDIMEISQFIKRFPGSRDDKYIDLPHGMRKDLFKL